jgi:hypothetical protein
MSTMSPRIDSMSCLTRSFASVTGCHIPPLLLHAHAIVPREPTLLAACGMVALVRDLSVKICLARLEPGTSHKKARDVGPPIRSTKIRRRIFAHEFPIWASALRILPADLWAIFNCKG